MPVHTFPISRRQLLVGAAAIASASSPTAIRAQTASDGPRILRARQVAAPRQDESRSLVWGFDGTLPGPTLRVKRGEELRTRLINELTEATSIHWHGVRVPNAMDGVGGLTQPAVAPGASFDYRFRPPDAGTFWYHAPLAGQSDRGLYGALIVDDTQSVGADRDIVLVFGLPSVASSDAILVNGAARPDIAVTAGERLRLRLINATSARGLALRIERHAPWLMAVDGQPAEPFLSRDGRMALAPGGRLDLFMDATGEAGTVFPILAGLRDEQPVARLRYSPERPSTARRSDPVPLPSNPLPTRIDLRTALRLDWDLGNSKALDPAGAPLFTARRGRAVVIALRNTSGAAQVIHVHGHSFRHLDRLDDGWKPYWLDTFVVGPETERIAFVADNPGKWLLVCRTLDRPERETQGFFLIN
jgi:FtsP/CotA-like multicopper oxidase with cupredoxin domain